MSLRNIGIVYRKELTEALRDRRTLISTILVPLLLFPVLTVGVGWRWPSASSRKPGRKPSKVMILGGSDSPAVVEGLSKAQESERRARDAQLVDLISNKKIRAAVEIPARLPGRRSQRSLTSGQNLHIFEAN